MRGVFVIAALMVAASVPAVAQEGPSIALGGDCLFDGPLSYQLRHRTRAVGREEAYREIFADLAPALRAADLAIVNLEVPVAPRERSRDPIENLPVFAAPEHFLDALAAAGVDAVTVANNHAYDQGVRGLRLTLRAIARRELAALGAGDDAADAGRAVMLDAGRARIAVAAWTEGTNHRPNGMESASPRVAFLRDRTIAASLASARTEAHLVIASFHWLTEGIVDPRPHMRAAAREAAEAGADLVYGHGTHVPGRTEIIETSDGRRVHVLYSLGNLLAAMNEPRGDLESPEAGVRDAPLAIVRTRWRRGRLEITEVELRHHWIARPTPAPWLESGRIAIERTVFLEDEIERIDAASCGAFCDDRGRAYRRRLSISREAMRPLESESSPALVAIAPTTPPTSAAAPVPNEPRPVAPRIALSVRAEAPARTEAPGRTEAPARTEEPARTEAPARTEQAAQSSPRSTPARASTPVSASDPRLAPYARGARIPVEFAPGAAAAGSFDASAVRSVVALMLEDRSLRAEITAFTAPGEPAELAALRARRAMGLFASRGPSRARFITRGGGAASSAQHVMLRLAR